MFNLSIIHIQIQMYLTNQINSEVPVFYMKDYVHPKDFAIKSLNKFPKPIPSICSPIHILAIVVQKSALQSYRKCKSNRLLTNVWVHWKASCFESQ